MIDIGGGLQEALDVVFPRIHAYHVKTLALDPLTDEQLETLADLFAVLRERRARPSPEQDHDDDDP